MNPHLASSLGIATAAIAAALVIASGDAQADDITVDNTPFISKASRAEVRSDIKRSGPGPLTEWTWQQNEPMQQKSSVSGAQVREDYLRSRGEVSSLTAEDSGSSYFIKRRPPVSRTDVMGAPAP